MITKIVNVIKAKIIGSSGNIADVNADGQLHIVAEGKVDTGNSTSATLLIDGVFEGVSIETLPYAVINVAVYSDVASAVNGLCLEFSTDNTNWDHLEAFTIPAATGKTFSFQPIAKYMRIIYTNGGIGQTVFRLQVTLKKTYIKPSSHRIQDAIISEDDAELAKAVLTGEDVVSGNFVNVGTKVGQVGNSLLVSVDQVEETTNSLKVIDYSHAELHSGDRFVAKSYEALAKNATKDFLIITPNTAKWAHMTIGLANKSGELAWSLYEDATVSANGTLDGTFNRNRNSVTANTTLIYEDPTVTGVGDLLPDGYLGSGKNLPGGEARDSEEILLKQNTIYLLRVVEQNVAATIINWVFDWYEHTNA